MKKENSDKSPNCILSDSGKQNSMEGRQITKPPNVMKAAVFIEPNKTLDIREYPVQKPGKGQVGLKLEVSGICGTDIHIHEGRLPIPGPMILGHEFIGTVDALGAGPGLDANGKKLRKGDTVVASVALPCGTCFNCKKLAFKT